MLVLGALALACSVVILVALLVRGSAPVSGGLFTTSAEDVMDACAGRGSSVGSASLSADRRSIEFESGAGSDSIDIAMLSCLLTETGAPSYVENRMSHTRALDGTQDAEWDGWSAFWNFHPDDGVAVTFTAN